MQIIRETVEIKARPGDVFDLIARVEDFSNYSVLIKKVRPIAEDTYRWTIYVSGVTLEWDAFVTECRRPERIAWRSVSGIDNTGTYSLTETNVGTQVTFSMQYQLPSSLLEKAMAIMAEPLMRKVSSEILNAVKARLENT